MIAIGDFGLAVILLIAFGWWEHIFELIPIMCFLGVLIMSLSLVFLIPLMFAECLHECNCF